MEASDNIWFKTEFALKESVGFYWVLPVSTKSTIKTSYGSAYHNMSSSNIYMMERLLYPTMTSSTIFNNNSVKIL